MRDDPRWPPPSRPPAKLHNLRDEHVRRGLVHLDRLAIRGTISSEVSGRYLPRNDRISWLASLGELGTLALFGAGILAIGAIGFVVWGLVN